ncbi:hypothetical protein B9Z55_021272 [Caenorhabditis nigoni]|uniref:F-box domain-containing protein n=1 Tax=Caenorhabditis nigoni TaxID=1611254 RepID=A0A2G5TS48_9PELO|nr:hypothetical protein B9Z55_021272 [Caenorhabditis nigoni]
MSSIIEMPELVLENIIEFLDFRSVLTLRQVCRDFRNFIDDLNDLKLPDSKFSSISWIVKNDIRMKFGTDGRLYRFVYSKSDNSRSLNGKKAVLENSNILDVAIRDLEFVLKFQKSTLREFHFLDHQLSNNLTFPNLHVKLGSMFKKLNRKIKTGVLSMESDSQSGFMSILPIADAETLETLALFPLDVNMDIEMDEIVKTEQWRKAKYIFCNFYALNMKVEDMCDFPRLYLKWLSISARDLDFLKKVLNIKLKN